MKEQSSPRRRCVHLERTDADAAKQDHPKLFSL